MPAFFVPGAASLREAEKVWQATKRFAEDRPVGSSPTAASFAPSTRTGVRTTRLAALSRTSGHQCPIRD